MVKFVEWENEQDFERFSIGVLANDEIYQEFKSKSNSTLLKNKPFDVIQFRRTSDIRDIHILYVDKRGQQALKKILDIAIAEQSLMITDSCSHSELVMINLLDPDMPGNQFEINKENMQKAKLEVSSRLLYYGGTEEDLRNMYQASERRLSSVREQLEKQTAELRRKQNELEETKQEILSLNENITLQEERLKSMISEIGKTQDSLTLKVEQLDIQKTRIIEQQANIDSQNIQLLNQRTEIENGTAFLEKQKGEIERQEQRINDQQEKIALQNQTLDQQSTEIQEQTVKIEKQRTLLYFSVAIIALIGLTIFFILRAYRIKRRANQILEEKNIAISKQKEEIQSQQDQLKIINRKIEKQNENIKSSIHYALTIQRALLPSEEEMNKLFETFIIYRPKDIVSGDYYWMCRVVPDGESDEKIFLAVADCTGHGVPGAFLSMIGIKLLNAIVNERKQYDPKSILEMLNVAVQNALKQERKVSDDGMDICLCCLEKMEDDKIKITYSGARRPLYYTRDGELLIAPGDRKTVGGKFYKSQVFTNREIHLNPGDRIYLSSDGIADQNAPNRQKFGSKRLVGLLKESLHLSMAEQKRVLEESLDSFQQNEKQRDDISLMAIKL